MPKQANLTSQIVRASFEVLEARVDSGAAIPSQHVVTKAGRLLVGKQVHRLGAGRWMVEGDHGDYVATPEGCSCPASGLCAHRLAGEIAQQIEDTSTE